MKITKLKQDCKDINKSISDKTCCFTGHRAQKLPWKFNEQDPRCVEMKKTLKAEIENAIAAGYNTFITGMALGFDMICAEIVLELKQKYKDITLVGAIPCKNQNARWMQSQKDRYEKIMEKLDIIWCIHDTYTNDCMLERNSYMLNNSSLVIALFNGLPGGTASTIAKAKKQGHKIIIIACPK